MTAAALDFSSPPNSAPICASGALSPCSSASSAPRPASSGSSSRPLSSTALTCCLSVCGRAQRRLARLADAPISHRRRMGRGHPPSRRSRGPHPAPGRPDVCADSDRHPQSLHVVARQPRRCGRSAAAQTRLSEHPVLPGPRGHFLRGLDFPLLVSQPLLRRRRHRQPRPRPPQNGRHIRSWPALLGLQRHLHGYRLGHVHRPALGFLFDVRAPLHHRPRAQFHGVPHHSHGHAVLPKAHV